MATPFRALRPHLRSARVGFTTPRATTTTNSLPFAAPRGTARHASSSSTSSTPPPSSSGRNAAIGLALCLLPLTAYLWPTQAPPLNPQVYTEHTVGSTTRLSRAHVELAVPLTSPTETALFDSTHAVTRAGLPTEPGEIVVQHVMIKNPSLMIERPYTPINDSAVDGEMKLVVKRVRGGEVGRMVHALHPGDSVGLRGPITTLSLNPAHYDTVVMLSTGTAVAPFLQLLAKAPVGTTSTRFKLLHMLPKPVAVAGTEDNDWSKPLLGPLLDKWGSQLDVTRIPAGDVSKEDMRAALDGAGRVLVLVCLPSNVMRPLCGTLTPTLRQGPLTGMLKDMGLAPEQVWKLE